MWRRRALTLAWGTLVVLSLLLLRAADPLPVRVARETTFDLFQQLRPRSAPPDLPVRIIDIDEASLAQLGQWPWPRDRFALMVQRLTELGAAAIALDVLFAEPDRLSPAQLLGTGSDYDADFARALAEAPAVLAVARAIGTRDVAIAPKSGYALTGSDTLAALPTLGAAAAPIPSLYDAAKGLGVASLDQSGAGTARRLPLLWSGGTAPLPTLSLEALRVAAGASTLVIMGDSTGARTIDGIRVGDFDIPTGPTGDLWLYYRPLPPETFISATALLADDYARLAPMLSGHIVLVGASAAGLLDLRQSSLGETVSGVSIHLQALEQILTGTYLLRADWVGGAELLALVLVGAAIVVVLMIMGPIIALLFTGMIAAMAVATSWFAFAELGLLLDPSFALFTALATYAAMAFFRYAVTDRDRRHIRRAFAHYIEPRFLSQIEGDPSLLRLGGSLRELTIMFCDVRNFTRLGARTAPEDLVGLLNRLFGVLGAAIVANGGTIDKFIGDAVMAFWNAPVPVSDHARSACLAALSMRKALRQLNAGSAEPIAIGIGIATGPALVGNIGFEARFNYSCLGDTVNIASRVEGACKIVGYDILITAETLNGTSSLATLPIGAVPLRGLPQAEPLHLLVGDHETARSPAFLALAEAHATLRSARPDELDRHLAPCIALARQVDAGLVPFYTGYPTLALLIAGAEPAGIEA
jgi:adenylate cyclase